MTFVIMGKSEECKDEQDWIGANDYWITIMGKSEECKDEQDWIGTNDCWITQPHIARKTQSYNSKWKVYSVYSI